MGLNPEKMEDLKEKYGITDDAIFEIAEALEPDPEEPLEGGPPIMGKPRTSGRTSDGGFDFMSRVMSGEVTMPEALIYLDWTDRRERREYERNRRTESGHGQQDNIEKLVNEMREERKEFVDIVERLVLGKRADDAEERAARAEAEKEELLAYQRQRDMVEGAVDKAVSEVVNRYDGRIESLASKVASLPENQRQGFFDEVFTDFQSDLKTQFKDMVLARLKAPEKPVTKKDEEGKIVLDWEGLADKGYKLLDKYIDSREKPPRVGVNEIPTEQGGGTPPFPDGPPEPIEAEFVEVKVEPEEALKPEVAVTPIQTQDIAGIGPARAKELEGIGISDARQLAVVGSRHLADSLGISKDKAEDIIKQAKDLVDQS